VTLRLTSIEVYDYLGSTMDTPPPSIPGATIAITQSRGRGRTGAWQSPPGGAWLTFHTADPPPPGLSVAVGGCLAAELEKLTGQRLQVKWPNDVLAPNGGKLAGILVEVRGGLTRIGIGVNVYNPVPPGAARLADLGYTGSLGQVAAAALEATLHALGEARSCIREAAARDALLGRIVAVETPRGVLEGRGAGITLSGALLLETRSGVAQVTCCHVLRWR